MSVTHPRGTSNGNCSGSAEDRRRRKAWLVNEFRADVDAITIQYRSTQSIDVWFAKSAKDQQIMLDQLADDANIDLVSVDKACRCYRCGRLLTVDTVFVDRRIPGAKGGTYARNNIRPNCSSCSAITGNELRVELAAAPACTTCGGRTKYRRMVNDHPCMSEFHGTPPTWRV